MWNESVARHVGWPSQITCSSPIISMRATLPPPVAGSVERRNTAARR